MSEQSAAWEYKEESPLREAWKMYLQNRAAELGLLLPGAVLLLLAWASWSTRWIPSRWSLRP